MLKSKTKTVKSVLFILFAVVSLVLCLFYKGGLSEYSSVLDRYLNFNSIILLNVSWLICLLLTIVWIVCFLGTIFRKTDSTKSVKFVLTMLLISTLIAIIVPHATLGAFQSGGSTVVNSVSDSVGAHVDYKKIFNDYDKSKCQEQTTYYKVCYEIPADFETQQYQGDYGVSSKCIQIIDGQLMNAYYKELFELYSIYNAEEFDADTVKSMCVTKGFSYLSDNEEITFVFIKNDKIFNITVSGKSVIDDTVKNQIVAL